MKLDNNPITPEERQACQGINFSLGSYTDQDNENEAPESKYQKNYSNQKYKDSYENPAPVYNEKPPIIKEIPNRSNYGEPSYSKKQSSSNSSRMKEQSYNTPT